MAIVAKYAAYAPMRARSDALKIQYPQIADFIAALKACQAEVQAEPITQKDLVEAIRNCKFSNSEDGLRRYQEYGARQH